MTVKISLFGNEIRLHASVVDLLCLAAEASEHYRPRLSNGRQQYDLGLSRLTLLQREIAPASQQEPVAREHPQRCQRDAGKLRWW